MLRWNCFDQNNSAFLIWNWIVKNALRDHAEFVAISMVLFSGKTWSNPDETLAKGQAGTSSPSRRSNTTKDVGESD
jgi:hypothetical protein